MKKVYLVRSSLTHQQSTHRQLTNRGLLSDLPQYEHFFPLKSPPKKDKFAVGPDILFATVLQRNSARGGGGGHYCTQQRPLHTKRTGYVTVGLKPETSVQSLLWTTTACIHSPGISPCPLPKTRQSLSHNYTSAHQSHRILRQTANLELLLLIILLQLPCRNRCRPLCSRTSTYPVRPRPSALPFTSPGCPLRTDV